MDIQYTISGNLRQLRRERNLSLDAGAELTGVLCSRLAQFEKGSVNPRSLSCGTLRMASKFRFSACWNRRRRPFPCCAQKHNPPSSPMAAGIAPIRPSPYSNRAPLKPTAFASGRAVLPPRIRISKVWKSLLPSAPAPSKWSSRTPAISCILAMHFIFRPMYRTDTAILFSNHCFFEPLLLSAVLSCRSAYERSPLFAQNPSSTNLEERFFMQ